MSLLRQASEPVRAPARRIVVHYHRIFEDLIHAVKSELVERLDGLDERLDELEEVVTGSHEAIADQLAVQSASLRSLETELERLQDLTRSLAPGPSDAPAPPRSPSPA